MSNRANNDFYVIPEQAETMISVNEDGYLVIWQEGLSGSDEATILIHKVFWPLFLSHVQTLLERTKDSEA